jgi:hypothetical protein
MVKLATASASPKFKNRIAERGRNYPANFVIILFYIYIKFGFNL